MLVSIPYCTDKTIRAPNSKYGETGATHPEISSRMSYHNTISSEILGLDLPGIQLKFYTSAWLYPFLPENYSNL